MDELLSSMEEATKQIFAKSYADKIRKDSPVMNVEQALLVHNYIDVALRLSIQMETDEQVKLKFLQLLQTYLNTYYKLSHLAKGANINLAIALEMIVDQDEGYEQIIFLLHCEQLHIITGQVVRTTVALDSVSRSPETKQEKDSKSPKKNLNFVPMRRRTPSKK